MDNTLFTAIASTVLACCVTGLVTVLWLEVRDRASR